MWRKTTSLDKKVSHKNKGKCLSRCLCEPHEVSHAGSYNNDIEFSTYSRHFDFEGSHSPETTLVTYRKRKLSLYFVHRTWRNYCFSIRWLIVCGRTNCLVLLGVADTVEGLFSTFSMKWIENNAFIWRYWTWEWETCRCYRHRSSLYKVRWFWYYKGSSSVQWLRFQGIKPEVNCTVFG